VDIQPGLPEPVPAKECVAQARIMQPDKLSARDVRFGKVALSTKARNFDRSLA